MTRCSLAVKYRPKTFEEVVEQDTVKQILLEEIRTNTVKRAYLFTGSAGTGKTSSGRLFANLLESYKANIIEINAADRTGVDDVRDIINQSKSKPLQGLRKIFIIDEVHALSQNAFSALLKLLEEPPAHCVFILCTTDPQKIIGTIMSRVYRYDFQKISVNGIVNRLEHILESEKNSEDAMDVQGWDMVALEHIAKSSNGGMRTAITTLDKCLSYSKNLTLDSVLSVLGTASYEYMFNLLDCLVKKDEMGILQVMNNLYSTNIDLKLFVKNFLEFALDVKKFMLLGDFNHVSIPSTYKDKLTTLTLEHKNYLKYLIAKLMQLNTELKWENNPKLIIECSLLMEVM